MQAAAIALIYTETDVLIAKNSLSDRQNDARRTMFCLQNCVKAAKSVTFDLNVFLEITFQVFKNTVTQLRLGYTFYSPYSIIVG